MPVSHHIENESMSVEVDGRVIAAAAFASSRGGWSGRVDRLVLPGRLLGRDQT